MKTLQVRRGWRKHVLLMRWNKWMTWIHMAAETDAGEETAIDESLGYTNLAPSPNPLRTYHLFLYLYLYQDAQPYHL
jgi:hypothetical protein